MLQIFSLPLKTVPSQQGGRQLDDNQDKEVHVHVSGEIFHVQAQSKVHKCVNKPTKELIKETSQHTTKKWNKHGVLFEANGINAPSGCKFRYICLQESVFYDKCRNSRALAG